MSEADSFGGKGKRGEVLVTIDNSLKDQTEVFVRQAIILRSQHEGVLSRIIDCLSDGANERPVIPLDDLMPNLSSCKVLLPSHYEYMEEEKIELTADGVDTIVPLNSFGESDTSYTGGALERYTASIRLVPATSMFNHSANPTCSWQWQWCGGCSIIVTLMDIKAGDELRVHMLSP